MNKRASLREFQRDVALPNGPRELRMAQRGNFPGTPRSPRQRGTLACSNAFCARLPRKAQDGGRPGGGSGRQPVAGDLRWRLLRASQGAGSRRGSRSSQEAAAAPERQSARAEDPLAQLRAELLKIHFQNCQLARSLLDLNMKMQQLKKACDLEIARESQSLDDNAVELEK
ncbi:Alanine and arginine-rich domain-containing protein [Galemys pyrenaicus]|uniref:Alanine and arginine-rich domain-containing protein n=1 Tax=Galemys pyrenaicus TaxID=202257 RepID=A0A8J6AQ83_GALPY|nr:Alanine and arginine-rich domain-containing protein [Galemys pyrenaicus]